MKSDYQYMGLGSPSAHDYNVRMAKNEADRIRRLEADSLGRKKAEHLKEMQAGSVEDYMPKDFNPFNMVANTQPQGRDYLMMLKQNLDKLKQSQSTRSVISNPFLKG